MGAFAANPMYAKGKVKRGDSTKDDFEQHVKDAATTGAEKVLKAEGADATDAVNTEALGKLMEGGGVSLERLNIAINWAQNLGLVMLFNVAWPEVRQYCFGGVWSCCWRNSNTRLRCCRVSRIFLVD